MNVLYLITQRTLECVEGTPATVTQHVFFVIQPHTKNITSELSV